MIEEVYIMEIGFNTKISEMKIYTRADYFSFTNEIIIWL